MKKMLAIMMKRIRRVMCLTTRLGCVGNNERASFVIVIVVVGIGI